MEVDPRSPVPLHEQVAAALRRAIAEGEAAPGERLPPARDLAGVLGVNANTVFRALRTLREEGLVEFRRGRGVTVTGEAPERSTLVERAASSSRSPAVTGTSRTNWPGSSSKRQKDGHEDARRRQSGRPCTERSRRRSRITHHQRGAASSASPLFGDRTRSRLTARRCVGRIHQPGGSASPRSRRPNRAFRFRGRHFQLPGSTRACSCGRSAHRCSHKTVALLPTSTICVLGNSPRFGSTSVVATTNLL